MLKFESVKPYSLEIDGKPYTLRGVGFDDMSSFESIEAMPDSEKSDAIKKFISDRADERTRKAIGTLGIKDVTALFKDWIGVAPGESSSSLES